MRVVLALSLLMALSASADAATVHRLRARPHVIVTPGEAPPSQVGPNQGVTGSGRFAVPGWSDEDTKRWLNKASDGWSNA